MPIPEEVFSRYIDAEMALRRQLLLRGYELGTGGERLEPEAAVAFLDAQFQPVLADALQAIREERHDLRQAGELAVGAMRAWSDAARGKLAAETGPSAQMLDALRQAGRPASPAWTTVRASELPKILAGRDKLVVVRKGGQSGIVCAPPPPRSSWQRLARGVFPGTATLSVRWESGTVSTLQPDECVEWCPLCLPS